jgi:hypothetical protein
MDLNQITAFLDQTSSRLETSWQLSSLSSVAGLRVPDFITGRQDSILRADINALWTQWFLESICDPERFVDDYPGYAYVFHAVKNEIPLLFGNLEPHNHVEISQQISRLIHQGISRRQKRKRIAFDSKIKYLLWNIYGPEPRCWICGYKFSAWAINKFLKNPTDDEAPKPQFIDYMKPIGLTKRDSQIEVDHVFPFSDGGDDCIDNLRLACGWCNTYKSDRLAIYDVAARPPVVCHPRMGRVTIPHPFWTVRLLSLRRQCEYEGGCDKTVNDTELTITSKHKEGALNPINMRVTCLEHDHLGSERFISRTLAEQLLKR